MKSISPDSSGMHESGSVVDHSMIQQRAAPIRLLAEEERLFVCCELGRSTLTSHLTLSLTGPARIDSPKLYFYYHKLLPCLPWFRDIHKRSRCFCLFPVYPYRYCARQLQGRHRRRRMPGQRDPHQQVFLRSARAWLWLCYPDVAGTSS